MLREKRGLHKEGQTVDTNRVPEGIAGVAAETRVPPLPPMCARCGRVLDLSFRYCPYCGQRQNAGTAWYYHPVWILVLAFVAVGPLAIPLVWRSKHMGTAVKAVMTLAISLYSIYVFYLFWRVLAMELRFSSELNGVLRELRSR